MVPLNLSWRFNYDHQQYTITSGTGRYTDDLAFPGGCPPDPYLARLPAFGCPVFAPTARAAAGSGGIPYPAHCTTKRVTCLVSTVKAMSTARCQQAKSQELRAAMSGSPVAAAGQ